ncbi:hypothetical protein, conserved [Eimeria tenella]|uniref:Uncharacterized protein n=1 Tax=Eimeria tenella TaxID=5802 RepID=U6KN22_EIMTE|nr:hypothetical protein, conserved [Eimeria tenella]CDJ37692.1 hypothetical protein, conserved [Eimeria tenella]|eukprot:XP_013228530.1 hypothetical protein, conserved [Eimeria tenella]
MSSSKRLRQKQQPLQDQSQIQLQQQHTKCTRLRAARSGLFEGSGDLPTRPAAATAAASGNCPSAPVKQSLRPSVDARSPALSRVSQRHQAHSQDAAKCGPLNEERPETESTPRNNLRRQPHQQQRQARALESTFVAPKGPRVLRVRGLPRGAPHEGPLGLLSRHKEGSKTAVQGATEALQGHMGTQDAHEACNFSMPVAAPPEASAGVAPAKEATARSAAKADTGVVSEASWASSPPSPLISEDAEIAPNETQAAPEAAAEAAATQAKTQPQLEDGETLADGLLGVCGEPLSDPPSAPAAAAASQPATAAEGEDVARSSSSSCRNVSQCLSSLQDLHTGLTPRPSQQQGEGPPTSHLLGAIQGPHWGAAPAQKRLLEQVSQVLRSNASLAAATMTVLPRSRRLAAAAAAAAAGATPQKTKGPMRGRRAPEGIKNEGRSSASKAKKTPSRGSSLKRGLPVSTPNKRGRSEGSSFPRSCSNSVRSSCRVREKAAAAEAVAAEATAAAVRRAGASKQKQLRLQQQQQQAHYANLECLLQDLRQEETRDWWCDEDQPELAAIPSEEAEPTGCPLLSPL